MYDPIFESLLRNPDNFAPKSLNYAFIEATAGLVRPILTGGRSSGADIHSVA